MADEAVLRNRFSDPVDFTCADNTGIEKGTIVFLSGARTVAPTAADNDAAIGVAAREKIGGDGRTQISVYVDGIFDCKVFSGSGAIVENAELTMSGANVLKIYTTLDGEKGYVFGRILEPMLTGTDDTVQVMITH